MKILFMTSHCRWWPNIEPLAKCYEDGGNEVVRYEARGDERIEEIAPLVMGNAWGAVVLCAEHLKPQCWVKGLLDAKWGPAPEGRTPRDLGRPPVVAVQHGLSAGTCATTAAVCDAYLVWGRFGEMAALNDTFLGVPIYRTGNARWDNVPQPIMPETPFAYVTLAYGEVTEENLEAIDGKFPAEMPILVKVHPTDRGAISVECPLGMTLISAADDPTDFVRECAIFAASYPTTALIDALVLGKQIVLWGDERDAWAPPTVPALDFLLEPGDANRRMAAVIESLTIQRPRSGR